MNKINVYSHSDMQYNGSIAKDVKKINVLNSIQH